MSGPSVSEALAGWLAGLRAEAVPEPVAAVASNVVLDIAGLCIAARRTDYAATVIEGWEGEGPCTALGQPRRLDAAGAALVNGTTAHGEDFDDTFEGAPLHAGAAAVPVMLALCERHGHGGDRLLAGIVAAVETMARIALVAPGDIHRAGFQPASVIGCIGAAAGAGVVLGLDAGRLAHAMGIAGSFSSGLMEFLAEGAWTKRVHPGWAGQAGLRAAMLARSGFIGPRRVLEGRNGFYKAFARLDTPELGDITAGLGETWVMRDLAFKLYPCGTMIAPYIDCARMARADGVRPADILAIRCRVAEAVAARQWRPLADKQRPANAFAARFSGPFGIALGLVCGEAGLGQYTEERVTDEEVLAVAAKVDFEIDPDNPFPDTYTGDLEITLADGSIRRYAQPHLRGGRRAPLSRAELLEKFHANIAHGGWSREQGEDLAAYCAAIFEQPDLSGLARFGA